MSTTADHEAMLAAAVTKDDLLALRLRVESDLGRIKGQINDAKRRAATGGGFADRDWLGRAEYAAREKAAFVQKIQMRLSVLKRASAGAPDSAPALLDGLRSAISQLEADKEYWRNLACKLAAGTPPSEEEQRMVERAAQ